MSRRIYIFAGGGTGGHLIPALAVAEELAALEPDSGVVFACSGRQVDRRILSGTPFAFVPQAIQPMPRSVRGWGGFLRSLLASRRLGRDLVGDLRPAAVFGLGGFAAVPVVQAAARAKVRCGLMSIDALPGLANRHLARRVQAIFTAFAASARAYGRWAAKAQQVGCPIRRALLTGDAQDARRVFGLRGDRKTLLVMSGSLGAANINSALAALGKDLDALGDRWQVLHVTGAGKLPQAAPPGGIQRVALEFCDRMDLAYAAADLVLCRAGAATVAELAAVARPAVFMPYPHHRDQHQKLNAAELVSAGAARAITDAADAAANAEALRGSLLEIMNDDQRLLAMRQAAAGRARTDAAEKIARWLAG